MMLIMPRKRDQLALCFVFILVRSAFAWLKFQPTFTWSRARYPRACATMGMRLFATSSMRDTAIEEIFDGEFDQYQARRLRFGAVGNLYAQHLAEEFRVTTTADSSLTPTSPPSSRVVLDRLQMATVAVFGLGGVGSWATEALCRSGVGNLILVDLDDVCISNTNRQLHALTSTTGTMKIDTMKKRLVDINPECNISLIYDFVSEDNVYDILTGMQPRLSIVLDAIDGANDKSALLSACSKLRIPVVTCGGAAGRMDPTKIVCADITKATGDKLLATCRKNLRKSFGFDAGRPFHRRVKRWNIDCVFSEEEVANSTLCDDDGTNSLRKCDGILGTACFVTGTYGFVAAGRVVHRIAKASLIPPTPR